MLVLDAGFGLVLLQEEGTTMHYVVRCAKNSPFRRAQPPSYGGHPLPRTYKGCTIAATPPDRVETWQEDGVTLCAEVWTDLVLSTAVAMAGTEAKRPTVTVVAVSDPRHREPLLLASSLPVAVGPCVLWDLYRDRWLVEHLSLAAKHMLGAARAFVHAPETCQRLPALALLARAILSYVAAASPALPIGFWDRRPLPTLGRLRARSLSA